MDTNSKYITIPPALMILLAPKRRARDGIQTRVWRRLFYILTIPPMSINVTLLTQH